jgi:glycoside/pentoside/hexuronide:cation symporter, GPH family
LTKTEAPAMPTLSTSTIWIYGSLGFPLALIGYPLGIWLPRAYATYIGIATDSVGTIMILASIFDAITDPVMGFASDRYRTRWGRRRVWVFIGAPFLLAALVYLLNPSVGSGVFYLGGWFVFLRIGSTMVGTPYGAWGAELSGEYHTRTRIVSVREVFVLLGLIGAALVPAIVEWMHGAETTAVQVLNAYTWPVVILLPLLTVLVVTRVPEPPPSAREGRVPFAASLGLMYRNKLFLRLIAIELCINGGEAFRNALSLFFMQDYIGVPRAGQLYLVYFGMGLIAIPFWSYLAREFGKHRSLAGAVVFVSAVSIAIFNLEHGQLTAFYVLFALKGFCFGAFAYLPRAMMADVIDLDTLKSGDARTGGYFAIIGFMGKLALSVGGVALIALSWVGYDTGKGAVHDASALQWLAILYAIVPTIAFMFGLYLCWTWPLTRSKHQKLQRLLETRQNRLKRDGAVSV